MRMKMGNKILWLMSCLLFCGQVVWGEKLTLQEAIQLAQASSPEAEAARHTYRAAYWSYRSFRADYLPEVSLSASPYLNRQINKVTQPDGTELFLRQNQLATDLTLSVSQTSGSREVTCSCRPPPSVWMNWARKARLITPSLSR